MSNEKSIRNILLFLLIIIIFAVLKELSGLLIPLALASLLTIVNLPVVKYLKNRRIPKILIFPLVAGLTLLILILIISLISGTVDNLLREQDFLAQQLSEKIDRVIIGLDHRFPVANMENLRQDVAALFNPKNITSLLGKILGSLGTVGSSSLLFFLYYILLLSGATGYQAYVDYVTGSDESGEAKIVWEKTQQSISAYMTIKTLLSLFTGLVAGFICWAFGLPFALFWGFLAFLLNFIPSIGSAVATILPLLMAIIHFNSFAPILGLTVLLGLTQFLIGSVLDPLIMGSHLRLNTVSVIFGLLFWGYIWGLAGMLLSIPLMVMARLLFERSQNLAVFARVMGYPEKKNGAKPLSLSISGIKLRKKSKNTDKVTPL